MIIQPIDDHGFHVITYGRALNIYGAVHCLRGAPKSYEKGIPLGIDFLSIPTGKCGSQNLAVRFQYLGILLMQPLEQPCRTFYVCEKKGHCATRYIARMIPFI